jgi:ribosomal peptide maturation radical SAM protein 1
MRGMVAVALVSTPWPLFTRPSIQLGALKAFLRRHVPGIAVDTRHAYLSVAEALGYDLYNHISERIWLSESVYAALLYPERREVISRFWRRRSSGLPGRVGFDDIWSLVRRASENIIDGADWAAYRLVGFSICFGQLTSALYFARKIKERAPLVKIILGGSACSGEMGWSLLRAFPEIDFVISGEGEKPLGHLARWVLTPGISEKPAPLPGLFSRGQEGDAPSQNFSQVPDLDALPLPDYDDYFLHLKSLAPQSRFFPKIPMEISRGCWWRKASPPRRHKGCAFCNLNLQWEGYRAKSQERVLRELKTLTEKHQVLSVSFVDNILPPKNLKPLFHGISRLGKDLRLFAEIRATASLEELIAMSSAGMAEVQVGIEALSTSLLKKLNKGTTTMENLEMMKNCEAPGLPALAANLIIQFPGSDEKDVEETLANLEFARPFRPLKAIPFWLGYGSPVWCDPAGFGIRKMYNHPYYSRLFPPETLHALVLTIQDYRGRLRAHERLWRPVKKAVKAWSKAYASLHGSAKCKPILSYLDGSDFLMIFERRCGSEDTTHRLKGASRDIYLFCERHRSAAEIVARFAGLGEEKVFPFLNMMVGKRLMFREGERYLSLAVPMRGFMRRGA